MYCTATFNTKWHKAKLSRLAAPVPANFFFSLSISSLSFFISLSLFAAPNPRPEPCSDCTACVDSEEKTQTTTAHVSKCTANKKQSHIPVRISYLFFSDGWEAPCSLRLSSSFSCSSLLILLSYPSTCTLFSRPPSEGAPSQCRTLLKQPLSEKQLDSRGEYRDTVHLTYSTVRTRPHFNRHAHCKFSVNVDVAQRCIRYQWRIPTFQWCT